MKVLVCGGRYYQNYDAVEKVLNKLNPTLIIEGGAHGADKLAYNYAKNNAIEVNTYDADGDRHKRANQQMLDEGKPDLVVAFPGGSGTKDMIAKAKKAGVSLMVIKTDDPITAIVIKSNTMDR